MTLFFSILVVVFAVLAAGLAYGWTRERTRSAELKAELEEARSKVRSDELQLSQRSHLDTIKDEFISTVSHELRTPLTSIRGALGLLSAGLMGTLDAKAHNLLRIAVTNTDRLIRLINDILDLERMESGKASLVLKRCSLSDLVQQAIDTMTAMAESAGVKLQFAPAAPAPPPIAAMIRSSSGERRALVENRREGSGLEERRTDGRRGEERRKSRDGQGGVVPLFFDGDSDRILQVLINLLSNAIKFSPKDSTVTIYLEAAPDLLHLRVSDEGRGIPADKLETIFDRFQQVEATDARQKGGTGLGLAICRSIIQQHGGSIWAERNAQAGVSLCVDLPRLNRATDQITRTTLNSMSSSLPKSEGAVLVCDDDQGIRTVVAEHLRKQGYRVIEAASGEETLALAGQQPLDAILLDLYMPGLSGWETLQRLKNTPATANIPVVILSVLSPAERPGIVGDAQGWVQKPFNENLLFAELGRVLHVGGGPGHVLLVEDDYDLASIVIASFEEAHVRINHAATRQQAMDQCKAERPDLLILDLTLPDGDGFSLVDWLRQQPELKTLPLVVYSGREVSEGERMKLRLGPTQFLTKAKVQPQEVEDLVLTMVHRLRPPAVKAGETTVDVSNDGLGTA
jgi:signal transduction histidine kinase/CheY-like chemotaxis protein